MIRQNLILYHCNDFFRCHRFVHTEDYMIVSKEDGNWLGTGMYFWDNLANAEYWMRKKNRKEPYKNYSIVAAEIYLDQLLDLTDINVCNKIGRLWEEYQKKNVINDAKEYGLGYKLNILFQSIPFFRDNFYVAKVYGKYNNTPKNKLWTYNVRGNRAEPTASVKCIYCVRNQAAIGEKEMKGSEK